MFNQPTKPEIGVNSNVFDMIERGSGAGQYIVILELGEILHSRMCRLH